MLVGYNFTENFTADVAVKYRQLFLLENLSINYY